MRNAEERRARKWEKCITARAYRDLGNVPILEVKEAMKLHRNCMRMVTIAARFHLFVCMCREYKYYPILEANIITHFK